MGCRVTENFNLFQRSQKVSVTMKPNYQISLLVLLMLTALVISCSVNKAPNDKQQDKSNDISEQQKDTKDDSFDFEKKLMGESSYIKTITDESAKEAHIYLPVYPDAKLDKSKGSYNESALGKYYNLVYYSDDSVETVAEFFKNNISEDYLVETLSPEAENWIHLEYKPEGVRHSGGVYIREASDGSTEIIYEVSIPAKQDD